MSEKIIERGFGESMKRFLNPMKELKLEYAKEIFKAFLPAVNGVIHIFFLEKVVLSLESSNIESFYFILHIYIAYILSFEIIFFAIRRWGWMNTLPLTGTNIYKKYLRGFTKMDNNKIELIGTGKLMGIISEGSKVWSTLISDVIEQFSNIFIGVIFTLYMVGRVDVKYGFLFLGLMIIFILIIRWINLKLTVFRSVRYELRNTRLRYVVKIIMSKMEILQAGKIDSEIDTLWNNSKKISQVSRDMATYRGFMKRIVPFILTLFIFTIFFYMGGKVLNGEMSLGVVVGLTGTLIIMQNSITNALGFYVTFTKQFISVEKLWNFFDTTPQIEGYETGNTFEYKTGAITLKNVNYGYTPENPIFKNFDLEIPGNQITALVGPSGGGKSTLVKLISGYIRQDSGDILVDSQNLKETSLKSYYKDIGYLTQEPSVFDGTVRENLEYGMSAENPNEASPSHAIPLSNSPLQGERASCSSISPVGRELREVSGGNNEFQNNKLKTIISLAHCEFIYDLPNGLDTEIGERGVKLSGGQKQRLAIAKIFLKDPQIIILDEPTSALDSLSEKKITEAMHNLFKNRTVIVIAHRLQTVKHADDIIVIEGGNIRERGTHEQLVKQDGFYKEMLDLQSGF